MNNLLKPLSLLRLNPDRMQNVFPIMGWGRQYDRMQFTGDMTAAVIVTIMLIPQSLAYALLAGLPAEVGLYASILPLVLYAVFGTSRALAVGRAGRLWVGHEHGPCGLAGGLKSALRLPEGPDGLCQGGFARNHRVVVQRNHEFPDGLGIHLTPPLSGRPRRFRVSAAAPG